MATFDVVFEGGGAKGVAFAGALEVLYQGGHRLARLVGTSAGAITATLCAAGFTPAEMLAAAGERLNGKPRFTQFMDVPARASFDAARLERSVLVKMLQSVDVPFIPEAVERRFGRALVSALLANPLYAQLFSFVECGGFFAGLAFLDWIREKLALKGIAADDTLETFHAKTGADLSLVVSDATDMEMLVLNHRTAPEVPVAWAVRMSMSIPFVWQEVIWRADWGTYLGRNKTGNVIVDGGVLSNFPMRLIATSDESVRAIMGEASPLEALNLGLMIDENLPVPGAPAAAPPMAGLVEFPPVRRVARLLDTMMGAWDSEMVRRFNAEICRLPAKGYGVLEFDMDGVRLDRLLEAARQAMATHLRARLR
jgi:predicted acylesterase/phospholipase RssA